jgi:hypothetical protein
MPIDKFVSESLKKKKKLTIGFAKENGSEYLFIDRFLSTAIFR